MNEQMEGLSTDQLTGLRRVLNSPVLTPVDPDYDTGRKVWNGMIDRKPSVIVRPTSIADVIQVVRFAREHGLAASVRGGGHSVAGKSVADGAMMIDLSLMNEIQLNSSRQTALAQGGAKWGAFDAECEKFGLATTGGVISSTGVCGLTLGGGIGWLMGKHGMSCDNVASADLVNADGHHLSVSATQNEDLFWAIRGGGGNFGIVTALEFSLHPLTSVFGGIVLYPRPLASDLLRQYRDLTANAPDEITAYAALLTGHGHPMAAVALCHSGSSSDREAASRRFCLSSPPAADMFGEKKYTELQTMLDFTAPAGAHYYFKCPFLRELTDEALRTILEFTEQMPSEQTQVVLEHIHGAASRVPVEQTAFGLRRVHYSINIMPAWTDPSLAEKCIAWAQEFAAALTALGASDAYVNYLGDEGPSAVKASYGANYARLAALKKEYDPDNFFRFNQNIVPAG
ncbi:MAG TPA: FAD-binding oxidoreductase [Terracidiphilus sp.]|jgi:FAD/FMN-containing dehydrogenase